MSHRLVATLLTGLLFAGALAGCAAPDENEEDVDPGATIPPPGSGGGSDPSVARLVVEDLDVRAEDHGGPLREDDANATVTYTVRAAEDAEGAQTAFVTLLVDGEVEHVDNLRLQPGESKEYTRTIPIAEGAESVHVAVRAGSGRAELDVAVEPWPRAGEALDLELARVTLAHLSPEPTDAAKVVVNLTLERNATGYVERVRVRLLCEDAQGALQEAGTAWPGVPAPGSTWRGDVTLRDCPAGTTRYGLEATVYGEGASRHDGRILV